MGKYSEMHIALQDEIMNLSHQAEEGELSHLDALIQMRKHRQEFEIALNLIKDFEDSKITEIENEISQYPNGCYQGMEFKVVNGRKMFNYKGIPAWIEAETNKKKIEEDYKLMFEGKIKGMEYINVTPDGEILPLPEVNYGKSYITVKEIK